MFDCDVVYVMGVIDIYKMVDEDDEDDIYLMLLCSQCSLS